MTSTKYTWQSRRSGVLPKSNPSPVNLPADDDNTLLWGIEAIAKEAQRDPKQMAYHIKKLRSAHKILGMWCARRRLLRAELEGRLEADT
jgi:hypothetical protein